VSRANPKVIGGFVVGAVALAVIGLGALGSGRLFRHTVPFVLYFPGGVEGLAVGAPVKFKGVEIGAVTRILLSVDQPITEPKIPVFIELDMDKILSKGGPADVDDPFVLRVFVNRGLRAELASQSLVTGQLFVELDFHPNIPARLYAGPDSGYREIPTIPNTLERAGTEIEALLEQLRRTDLAGLVRSASQALDGIHRLVDSPEVKEDVVAVAVTLRHADRALADLDQTASRLEQQVAPLTASLSGASEQARKTLADADHAIGRAGAAIDELETTLAAVRAQVEPGSPIAHELVRTLDETAAAARAVRDLAEYLQRNPSSLLRGRPRATEPR
jgi:paraquat-inducible protein B